MLKILQIEKNEDFYNYASDLKAELVIISPNPQTADIVRSTFAQRNISVESITIAKFIKDQLNELQISEVLENFRGKSELILLLGAIWKKIGREPNYVKFNRAFNLLTELRSFSLNEQVLQTVLEQYDQEIQDSVLWLSRFLVQLEIVDEHQSYFILSEKLRESNLPPEYANDQHLVFYGFDYLAASQVDLLKSLSLRNDVYIPIYKSVIEKSQGMDWINWFDEHNKELIDISSELDLSHKVILQTYPKGYLAKALTGIETEGYDVVLGTKEFCREYIQEVAIANLKTKVSINLFEHDFAQCSNELVSFLNNKNTSTEEVREFIRVQVDLCVKQQNFKLMKCYFVVLAKINEWESLSDDNNSLNVFDVEIITKAAMLDLPRTNLATLSSNDEFGIYNLKHLQELKSRQVRFLLNSNYLSPSISGGVYTENVEKYLASIGPVRRAEFDLAVLKARLKEFFACNQVELLMENGLIDHEPVWSDLLEDLSTQEKDISINFNPSQYTLTFDAAKVPVGRFSASRLQRYMDCPRSYYEQYGLKQSPQIILPSELSVLDLGQLEHKVIEKYFEQYRSYDEKKHEDMINIYLGKWIQNKELAPHIREEYFIEIKSYTSGVIELLCKMKEELQLEHQFEYEFSSMSAEGEFIGSIDCYLYNAQTKTKIILDFKRSNSVFTSYKSILEYEKIQLWFYLKRLLDSNLIQADDNIAIGYIDLSHLENSMLFVNHNDFCEELKKNFAFKKSTVFEDFSVQISQYCELESQLVSAMQADQTFAAKPKDSKVCSYCSLKNICPKETHGNS